MFRLGRRLLTLGLALGLVYFGFCLVAVWWAARTSHDPVSAPAAVVLGAAQWNGEPSPVLRGRLDVAAGLYESGSVQLIVVTGGQGTGDATTEAKVSYDYLRGLGIPDDHLRLEVQGVSTYLELAATARFLKAEGITDVVVVTDPFHQYRSQLIAAEVGLDPAGAGTTWSAPLDSWLREAVAVAAGRIVGFRRLDSWAG